MKASVKMMLESLNPPSVMKCSVRGIFFHLTRNANLLPCSVDGQFCSFVYFNKSLVTENYLKLGFTFFRVLLGVLIIYTRWKSGGNLVHKHKTTKFDVVGERPASNSITKSTEQTKKSGKSASPQITSPCFLSKLPKRKGGNHLIFQQEFPVFPCKHYSGGSRGEARGARAPFFRRNWGPKGRRKILRPTPPPRPPYLRVWMTGSPSPLTWKSGSAID